MERKDLIGFLQGIELLQTLSSEEFEKLVSQCTVQKAKKYQFIYMPDERADHVYFLVAGRLKCGTFSPDGREVIKGILKSGAVFGDMSLAGESHRSDFTQALYDDVRYLSVKIADFQAVMMHSPRLNFSFMNHLRNRLNQVETRLSALILKDARSRIIDFLTETADKDGKSIGYETLIKHRLTQQDIANLTGTSRQTVTSVFNDLRKSNLIYFTRNSILIRDMAKLA